MWNSIPDETRCGLDGALSMIRRWIVSRSTGMGSSCAPQVIVLLPRADTAIDFSPLTHGSLRPPMFRAYSRAPRYSVRPVPGGRRSVPHQNDDGSELSLICSASRRCCSTSNPAVDRLLTSPAQSAPHQGLAVRLRNRFSYSIAIATSKHRFGLDRLPRSVSSASCNPLERAHRRRVPRTELFARRDFR